MNTSEKMLHVVQAEGPRQIAVTHVTIRQSITKKYYTILQCLLPQSDQKKIGIREHVIEPTVGISHK